MQLALLLKGHVSAPEIKTRRQHCFVPDLGLSSFCKCFVSAYVDRWWGACARYDNKMGAGTLLTNESIWRSRLSLKGEPHPNIRRKYLQTLFNPDLSQYIYSMYIYHQTLHILTTQKILILQQFCSKNVCKGLYKNYFGEVVWLFLGKAG